MKNNAPQTFAATFALFIIIHFLPRITAIMPGGLNECAHRRYNPLTGEWILVSPHRMRRPWEGQAEKPDHSQPPAYVKTCYLCPGNTRAGGIQNPDYRETFVFTNDFGALLPETGTSAESDPDELFISEPQSGICRVICYSPRHDLTIARMRPENAVAIVDTWIEEYRSLASNPAISHVQIFENRGAMMGCSNPHPHGQIWASSSVPATVAAEVKHQQRYHERHQRCLLCTYLDKERGLGERILFENSSFVALVPYWAVWPFETMIIPRHHQSSIEAMSNDEKRDLAAIMVELGICYDNLFLTAFPYSMGIHQQPTDGRDYSFLHYHFHYLPPLLRSSSIKKHMVGYEILAEAQRDLTPEAAAARLRKLPKAHFLNSAVRP